MFCSARHSENSEDDRQLGRGLMFDDLYITRVNEDGPVNR